ncbi:hypothetical protein [Sandaracinus amylolyticus]|uniref:hypothetical protein n=1 Tax=Sandaracinus amylolyticus TaxID=927083 RepID=UPI001F303EDF|nr:hypothetical protein [Sandaracinus amylolyticus]UJR84933.1 Hypothetical protein I5071_70120 [Sandaracinus amylolyticus]
MSGGARRPNRSGPHRIVPRLGPDARALIEAARAADDPSAADRARVRRAMMASIAAGAAAGAAGTAASASAASGGAIAGGSGAIANAAGATAAATGAAAAGATTTALGVLGMSTLAKVAAIALVVSAGGAVVAGITTERPQITEPATEAPAAHQTPASPEPPAVVTAPPPVAAPELTPEPLPIPVAAPSAAPARPRRTTPTRAAPPPVVVAADPSPAQPPAAVPDPAPIPVASLHDELPVLRRAWSALRDARPDDALRALDEHRARFPSGELTEERDAARALALCAAGRADEGRAALSELLAAHPRSPLAARVRTACE